MSYSPQSSHPGLSESCNQRIPGREIDDTDLKFDGCLKYFCILTDFSGLNYRFVADFRGLNKLPFLCSRTGLICLDREILLLENKYYFTPYSYKMDPISLQHINRAVSI